MGNKQDVVRLTEDDYKKKSFKTAPGGTYHFKISKQKSNIKAMKGGTKGIQVIATITKGPHKGVNVFDNIAVHVGWKIAQLLHALGVKKLTITLKELLELIGNKELRAVIREKRFDGKMRNEIVQWLPLSATKGADDDDDDDLDESDDTDDENDTDDDAEDGDDDASDDDSDDDDSDDDDDASDDDDDDADDDDSDDDDDADDDDDDASDDDDDDDASDDDDDADESDDDDEEEAPPKKGGKKAAKKQRAEPPKKKAAKPAAKKVAAKKTSKRGR